MSDSLRLQLPTATYITVADPLSGSGSRWKNTRKHKSSALQVDFLQVQGCKTPLGVKRRGLRLCVFSLHLLAHFLLQETGRPTDVNGGPVSASQPLGVLSEQRGDLDGRAVTAAPKPPPTDTEARISPSRSSSSSSRGTTVCRLLPSGAVRSRMS